MILYYNSKRMKQTRMHQSLTVYKKKLLGSPKYSGSFEGRKSDLLE